MDIQETRGSDSELSHVPLESTITCPGCAAEVISGDRFCQECGTRISTNRARNRDKKAKASLYTEGTASVICFNCGTTNQALSKVCSDCKIPLVTESAANNNAIQGGLRGSIANKSKSSHGKVVRTKSEVAPATPGKEQSEHAVYAVPSLSSSNNIDCKSSQSLEQSSTSQSRTVGSVVGIDKTYDAVFKKATETNHEALDYLFSTDSKNRSSLLGSFDKLICESRNFRNVFSLTTFVVLFESVMERVPTPLVFLVLSLVIVVGTVSATTQWNRHEQRLQALDKIAANAEENMRRYELDNAIRTLRELDRTEKGDLPPRARSVLNQCLWLRSYKFAKEKQYGRALKDLSRVTPDFVSYDDVREKKDEFEKLLARHPEFSGDAGYPAAVKTKRKIASSQIVPSVRTKPTDGELPGHSVLSLPKPNLVSGASDLLKSESQSSGRKRQERLTGGDNKELSSKIEPELANPESREQKDLIFTTLVAGKQETAGDKKTKKSPKGNLPDRDMKRYSDLLVDYFSREQSGRTEGEQISEPPSFEEWVHNGKGDF